MRNKFALIILLLCLVVLNSCKKDVKDGSLKLNETSLSVFLDKNIKLLTNNIYSDDENYFSSNSLKHLSFKNLRIKVDSFSGILTGKPLDVLNTIVQDIKDKNGNRYTNILELPQESIQRLIVVALISNKLTIEQKDALRKDISNLEHNKEVLKNANKLNIEGYKPQKRFDIKKNPSEWLEEELISDSWNFQSFSQFPGLKNFRSFGKFRYEDIDWNYREISDVKFQNGSLTINWDFHPGGANFYYGNQNDALLRGESGVHLLYYDHVADIINQLIEFSKVHKINNLTLNATYIKKYNDKWGDSKQTNIPVLSVVY